MKKCLVIFYIFLTIILLSSCGDHLSVGQSRVLNLDNYDNYLETEMQYIIRYSTPRTHGSTSWIQTKTVELSLVVSSIYEFQETFPRGQHPVYKLENVCVTIKIPSAHLETFWSTEHSTSGDDLILRICQGANSYVRYSRSTGLREDYIAHSVNHIKDTRMTNRVSYEITDISGRVTKVR